MSGVRVHNFFDVRWSDGFSAVFDGTNEVRAAVEDLLATIAAAREDAVLTVRAVELGGIRDVFIAVVRFDAYVTSARRFNTYLHAVVCLARGFQPLTVAAWERLVKARYGDDLESRLDELINDAADTCKLDGIEALAARAFSADDVAAVLEERAPAPVIPPPPPPPAARRRWRVLRSALATLWGAKP